MTEHRTQRTDSYLPWLSLKNAVCVAILALFLSGCGGGTGDGFGGGTVDTTTSSGDTTTSSGGSPIVDSGDVSETNTPETETEVSEETQSTVEGATITLNWTEPSLYENGEALSRSEIESYEILWGLSETGLSSLTVIDDPNTLEYIVDGLFQGVYYFSISITTIYGNTSEQSNIIRKVII